MKTVKSISTSRIHFKQPRGLHMIAIMTFFICLSVAPFITLSINSPSFSFFYQRDDYLFIIFFSCVFGCISNYLFGSTKSIIHGLQFIIIAIIFSFIRNIYMFSAAMLWVGIAVVVVSLLYSLSAFYLKTDSRRIYGFLGVYSSCILGVTTGIFLYFIILKDIQHFKLIYLVTIFLLLIYFLRNNYKLNTSLSNQTERFDVSIYGIFVIYFGFSLLLFYLLQHTNVFSSLNLIILPISLALITYITLKNNKENGKELLKFVYLSLSLIIINKVIYLTMLAPRNTEYMSSYMAMFILMLLGYFICLIIYQAWRYNFLVVTVDSILNSTLIRTLCYIEFFRVILLGLSVVYSDTFAYNALLLSALILKLGLNAIILPVYFSLGKILAGGKNEQLTTILLYLIFSSVIFVSFLYDISINF